MSKKKTFRIKLDAEFTIDFDGYGFSDAQKSKEEDFKRMIMNEYLDQCGFDEFDVSGFRNQSVSLSVTMADMFKPNKK